MSTLISELDSAPGQGDGDFVQNILNEMNGGSVQPPPAVGGFNGGVINSPNPNSVAPMVMDNGPVTSHMIGNSHPTPADFTQMMNTHQPVAAPQGGNGPMGNMGATYNAPQQYVAPAPAPKRSWLSRSIGELRVAVLVAILVFVFSLPVVNFLFSHYIPYLVKSTGELTWIGLLVKSLVAGLTFWIIQRVVVPLLSL